MASGYVYHERKEWADNHPAPDVSPASSLKLTSSASMFIHHTAGLSIGIDSIPEQIATMRGIWHHHVNVNGWSDIGYNFVVCPPHGKLTRAHIWVARGWDKIPAAQEDYNTGNWAIAVIGNYDRERPDPDVLLAIEAMMRRAKKRGAGYRVRGHRDVNQTSCPGDKLYAKLKTLAI